MHRSTERSRPRWSELEHAARVDERLSTWNDTFGANAATGPLFQMVQATSTALRDECLPLVFQHGDFNVWNLVADRGHLGVIDWEGAVDGLPLCDAFQLATSWLHAVSYPRDRLAERLAVRDIFIAAPSPGIAALAAHRALAGYVRRIRIDPRFVPLLLVLHRIELVARRIEQSRLQGEETRDSQQIPEYPVVSLLAAHAHALFARDWSTAP
jgi:aminoglycoside phosphotransferase (APT) family kinase protein